MSGKDLIELEAENERLRGYLELITECGAGMEARKLAKEALESASEKLSIAELEAGNERLREALQEFVDAMDKYGHPDKSLRLAKRVLSEEQKS